MNSIEEKLIKIKELIDIFSNHISDLDNILWKFKQSRQDMRKSIKILESDIIEYKKLNDYCKTTT